MESAAEGKPNKPMTGLRSCTMTDADLLKRITADPAIFGGKPIIRGMRISVEMILGLLAQGENWDHLLDDYPDLQVDDIRPCLAYAATRSSPMIRWIPWRSANDEVFGRPMCRPPVGGVARRQGA